MGDYMKYDDNMLIEKDEYYLFYEMMMQSLKEDGVIEGINKSLYLLKMYLSSGHVVLHKKNENGLYKVDVIDSTMNDPTELIPYFVNKTKSLVERKKVFSFKFNLTDNYRNMMLLHINTIDNEYIISINNYDSNRELDEDFWNRLRDTMFIILKRAESYQHNMRALSIDLLTDLNNRNSYELRVKNLDNNKEYTYGLFDLFRLKYVNDNYSHSVGDIYIKKTAQILNKYWPKQKVEIIDNQEKLVDTGHTVYRIGGDEFALITNGESIELTKLKASLAAEEVSMIDLGIDDDLKLGLNCGIIEHVPGESFRDTSNNADALMNQDKNDMYLKYGLERRK